MFKIDRVKGLFTLKLLRKKWSYLNLHKIDFRTILSDDQVMIRYTGTYASKQNEIGTI